ncbi:DUF99 domain-containing protein [Halobacteriales archaeon QS_6_71_20]|nr:MAG: DUF99 domain-containing protein [Halobacteriales archaeon QS_6_71_20]
MKPGTRALGLAVSASHRDDPARATVAGAVVRVDGAVDGLSFSTCSVGGTDATAAVIDCFDRLGREDVRHLLLAGVAPAWFNVIDLAEVREATDRPTLAVSFETSEGLASHLRERFAGDELDRRLATYASLPERVPVRLDAADGADDTDAAADPTAAAEPELWVRAVGADADEARRVVGAHTPDGRTRPEPLRVAAVAARAGRSYADRETRDGGTDG